MNTVLGYLLVFLIGFGITISLVGHLVIGGLIFVFVCILLVLGSSNVSRDILP